MSNIFIIDADSFSGVEEQLKDAKTQMLKSLSITNTGQHDGPGEVQSEMKKDPTSFAIIVNGYSLVVHFVI